MGSGFRGLVVYGRAGALADEIRDAVLSWGYVDARTLGIQLIRSADSVAANIAEATGRRSLKDQARLLIIARGSLHELECWLTRAEARRVPLPPDAQKRASEIARMLNGLIRSTRRPRN